MSVVPERTHHARKMQARATETRGAICEAAMQLLLKDGLNGLTTIRISKRAGVSVGTYYQYFGNKEALLMSLVEQHLTRVTKTLQAVCKEQEGRPLEVMVAGFLEAYIRAQLEQWNSARVIYGVALEIGAGAIMAQQRGLVTSAVAAMLGSTRRFAAGEVDLIALTFFGAVSGATRAWLDDAPEPGTAAGWEKHLERLGVAYLESFGPEMA